ncbi:MAG: hypothetical protein RMK29_08385 [Myxococcales bacterium]|nr:hypothetical protein [Myxococcota bacterium]MDW8281712.1 hypothetical protein [Myxococcales bacterium]
MASAIRLPVSRLAGLLLLLCGCSAATPEAACARFVRGVRQGDGAQVFDALFRPTQWSLYSVARCQSEMRKLILRDYPPAERQAALARLMDGQSNSGRDLFQRIYGERYAQAFQRRLGQGPLRLQRDGEAVLCGREGGEPFRFELAKEGGWGMAELDREWEQAKVRAHHDLDTVRDNARLYREARTRPQETP